jgi:hypothetical protein
VIRPVEPDEYAGEWAALRVGGVGLLVGVFVFELVSFAILIVGGPG